MIPPGRNSVGNGEVCLLELYIMNIFRSQLDAVASTLAETVHETTPVPVIVTVTVAVARRVTNLESLSSACFFLCKGIRAHGILALEILRVAKFPLASLSPQNFPILSNIQKRTPLGKPVVWNTSRLILVPPLPLHNDRLAQRPPRGQTALFCLKTLPNDHLLVKQ